MNWAPAGSMPEQVSFAVRSKESLEGNWRASDLAQTRASPLVTYDSTLDYEDAAGTGANVAFDGGQATVITAAGPDGTDTKVLEVVKTDGGKTWAA